MTVVVQIMVIVKWQERVEWFLRPLLFKLPP